MVEDGLEDMVGMRLENKMSEKGQDLPAKIKEWLENQGHSMEMRVAKVFRENGFDVSQFEHYVDQETETVRQVDIVAYLSRDVGNCSFTIRLIIECKYSKSKPWVILVTPKKLDKFAFFQRILQGINPRNWKEFPSLQGRLVSRVLLSLDKPDKLSPFIIDQAGYSVLDVRIKNGDDELNTDKKRKTKQTENAFEATIQVSKSVEAHDVENEELYKNTIRLFEDRLDSEIAPSLTNFGLYLSVAFPVIVIHGQLFTSYLGDDNQIKISEIDNGVVLLPYRQKENRSKIQVPLSPVLIVTEQKLGEFITKIKMTIESLLQQDDAIFDLIEYEQAKITKNPDTEF